MNKLLKYDTQHIRVFSHDEQFIKLSHYEDEFLMIADCLFAQSATLKVSDKQMQECHDLVNALKKQQYRMVINYDNTHLSFSVSYLENHYEYSFTEEQIICWQELFIESTKSFATADNFNLPHHGKKTMILFFEELQIPIPSSLTVLEVYYTNQFFCIPFEFLYGVFMVKQYIPSSIDTELSKIHRVAIMYDPDLELSKEESLNTLKLLEKRAYILDQHNPDLVLVSAHGMIDQDKSYLVNDVLESLVLEKSPKVIIFNSCLLAQCPQGIIQNFLDKGCVVIASPFYTLCNKTIFGPLLRFLNDSSGDSVWKALMMLKIFYPRIYRYFRIYIPYNDCEK